MPANDVDRMLANFYGYLRDVINESVPAKSFRRNHNRPWMSPAALRLRNRKRAAGRRAKLTGSSEDRQKYVSICDAYADRDVRDYESYVRHQRNKLKSDPKNFWRFVDTKRNCKDLPSEMFLGTQVARGDKEIANLFAKHFGSVSSHNADVDEAALDFDTSSIPLETDVTCESFSASDVLGALH